jgi:hypothetical protein
MGRKKAAARARRMVGQGLDPLTGLPKQMADPYKDTQRLVNPWVEPSSGRGEDRRGEGGGGVDFWWVGPCVCRGWAVHAGLAGWGYCAAVAGHAVHFPALQGVSA